MEVYAHCSLLSLSFVVMSFTMGQIPASSLCPLPGLIHSLVTTLSPAPFEC